MRLAIVFFMTAVAFMAVAAVLGAASRVAGL